MRKYFLSIVALVGMLFATSCQERLVEPQIDGTTTFTVQVPNQMGTKAIGEASSVTQLLVDVYPFGVGEPIYQTLGTPTSEGFEVELNLIQDQKYDILFWAQTKDGYVKVLGNETDGYSFRSLREVPMNSNYLNNDNGAAFFHAEKGFVPSGTSTTITLVRPFAQLNLGTTDLSLKPATGDVQLLKSLITVKGVATNFNVYEGLGFGNKDVVYVYGPEVQGQEKQPVAVPTDPETLTIGEGTATQTFNYISMNYLAVLGDTKAVVDVDAEIIVKDPAINGERTIEHSFKSVPVQENYRTNIVGNLISSTTDFIVEVNDNWVGDYTEEYVAPGIRLVNDVYEITSEEGLWSFAELVNGGTKAGGKSFLGETIKLTCDIDLENQPWTPISLSTDLANDETFRGTFDGNGHTIEGLYVNRNDVAGLFGYVYAATIKNVTVKGARINSNHYAGGIVGWALNNTGNIKVPMIIENCHVKNSIIASTPELVNGEWDNGDKVGGIIGYAAYIGGTGGDINDGAGIFRCSVESTTIKAYRDFGGIVGYAKSVKIEQPKVQNVTLEQDLSQDYQSTTPTTYGQIIGRDEGGNIVDGVSLAVTVTASEELEQVVNNATTDITVELGGNLDGHISLTQNAGIDVTIIGNDYTYTGTLHIWGNGASDDRSMTIKNIDFVFNPEEGIDPDDQGCIYTTGNVNGKNSYACNVTIEDCTFTNYEGATPGAAIRQNVAGEKDWTIKNCTVANNMHSLLQVSNTNKGDGAGLLVQGCEVYSKNGANLNSTCYATFIDCVFDVKGYAVRVGVNSGGNPDETKVYTFTGCTLKSENVDRTDAVIVIRKDAQKATLNFVETTLDGDPMISGNTSDTKINGIELPQQDNEIWYTATALVHAHFYKDKFGEGTDLVSNVWDETTGKGVITLSGDVTIIGVNAFYGREHLLSVSIPNSVTEIGEDAFDGCPNLTTVQFSENLKTIGPGAFGGCGKLTNVVLPEGLTTISDAAFQSCEAMASITIPSSVTNIGASAFNLSRRDFKVYCKPTTPPTVGYKPFNSWWAEIYVPTASLAAYQDAWGSIADNIYDGEF